MQKEGVWYWVSTCTKSNGSLPQHFGHTHTLVHSHTCTYVHMDGDGEATFCFVSCSPLCPHGVRLSVNKFNPFPSAMFWYLAVLVVLRWGPFYLPIYCTTLWCKTTTQPLLFPMERRETQTDLHSLAQKWPWGTEMSCNEGKVETEDLASSSWAICHVC